MSSPAESPGRCPAADVLRQIAPIRHVDHNPFYLSSPHVAVKGAGSGVLLEYIEMNGRPRKFFFHPLRAPHQQSASNSLPLAVRMAVEILHTRPPLFRILCL